MFKNIISVLDSTYLYGPSIQNYYRLFTWLMMMKHNQILLQQQMAVSE